MGEGWGESTSNENALILTFSLREKGLISMYHYGRTCPVD